MKYAKIRKYDTSNWDGINTTIFFSGCKFNCLGCFNKEAQDFNYGKDFTKEVEDLFISYAKDTHVVGVCLLGGEIFQQDLWLIFKFVERIKKEVNKPVHLWTGYKWEELLKDPKKIMILEYCDTLVDGQFEIEKKDLTLKYRGSSNQRVIDIKKSLIKGDVITIT